MKIKAKDLPALRVTLLAAQHGRCRLCREPVAPEDAVADHDHRTGVIRGVLHRGCNSMLGKIENHRAIAKLGSTLTLSVFLNGIIPYLARQDLHTSYIYPTHRTPEAIKEAANKRRRVARAKAKK